MQIHPLGHILVIKSSNCSNKLFLNSYNKCIRCTVDSCTVSKGLKHWYYGKVVVIYFYFISNFRENMDNQSSSRYVYISLSLSLNAPPPPVMLTSTLCDICQNQITISSALHTTFTYLFVRGTSISSSRTFSHNAVQNTCILRAQGLYFSHSYALNCT